MATTKRPIFVTMRSGVTCASSRRTRNHDDVILINFTELFGGMGRGADGAAHSRNFGTTHIRP
jgi:hypothetical protein